MESRIPYILGLLMLALVASGAALAPEAYWNSVLPNTPMPKAIKDLLHPDMLEDKGTSVAVGKGGVNVDAGKGKPGGGTHVGVGGKGVGVDAGKPGGGGTNFGFDRAVSNIYAASEDQIHDNPNLALFFLQKDLKPGKSMNLDFPESSNTATFLPRHVADSIPFSSNKLQDAFREFSVKPGSLEAEIMENTVKECENPGIEGEEKYCATSLESMVDFSTSKLGKDIQAISTEVEKQTGRQKYTIAGVKKIAGDKCVVCHKQNYPYAVFYCHSIQSTRAYLVQLKGVDRTRLQAVAICHTNTSAWNPKHPAFQVLAVKPGTVPICHFLPQSHVVWVPK
uniref:BURP domain-containing protein n=1 Tax=Bruguiera gymnorhiza TaxID=39984 RepID=Q93XI3_BRUGY|nr:BURP domain-containing protein [Bruguiera gymnorhiza]